jgi:hypothetical protein
MKMPPPLMLTEYFAPQGQRLALEEYGRFARAKDWTIGEKMEMYKASRKAFDPGVPYEDAFNIFRDEIYEKLSKWQWYRPVSLGACWTPQQIFQTIRREFAEFEWGGPVFLPNLMGSGKLEALLSSFLKMREIKPNADFPTMAVSKFLHPYNPALFLIYDTEVIWKKVLGKCFREEFNQFCSMSNLPYSATKDSAELLRSYMAWAGSLVASAPNFMDVFVDWLGKQPGSEGAKTSSSLYSTAFEFTIIGAAKLSCPHLFDEKSKTGCK